MTPATNLTVVLLRMRWSRLWLMLGCLLVWGGSSALTSSETTAGSKADASTSQGLSARHGNVAALDDVEADRSAWLNERLRPQRDAHAAPHWQHVSAPPNKWLRDRVAIPTARRATAPPLVGMVELRI